MITQLPTDEVAEQQRLLHTYRRTLGIYLRQVAELGGVAYSPPALLNGIDEARCNIARIKGVLRATGVDVAEDPDDEGADEWATTSRGRTSATPPAPWTPPKRVLGWIVLACAGLVTITMAFALMRWIAGANPALPPHKTPLPATWAFTVEGASMEPTFAQRQTVKIAPVDSATLRRGDVVLVDPFHKTPFLKRVIGLPGDTVSVRDGRVYLNGAPLDEPYVGGVATTCWVTNDCADGKPVRVPDGSVFVLGDNRMNSADSREYGPVPFAQVKGRVA